MQFSSRFKQLCKERNITQKKALEDMGFHRNAAQRWADGSPSTEALVKIAEYFGISTDEVLGVENKKAPTPKGEREYSDLDLIEAVMRADERTKEVIRQILERK